MREAIDDRESGELSEGDPSKVLDLLSTKHGLDMADVQEAKTITLRVLDGCYKLLAPTGFEFAYRVVKEVHDYMYVWTKAQLASGISPKDATDNWIEGLDRAIFQKVLPKIHGNRAALGDSLKALSAFLAGSNVNSDPAARYSLGVGTAIGIEPAEAITLPTNAAFTRCQTKLSDMNLRLVSHNYVSFVK